MSRTTYSWLHRSLLLWLLVVLLAFGSGSVQSAAPGPAPTFQCTGLVVDIHAQPIAGARVECYQVGDDGSLSSSSPVLEHASTTDEQGRFEFRVSYSPKILVSQKPGFAPAWTYAAEPGAREWRLVASPPAEISGLVLDKDKRPVGENLLACSSSLHPSI